MRLNNKKFVRVAASLSVALLLASCSSNSASQSAESNSPNPSAPSVNAGSVNCVASGKSVKADFKSPSADKRAEIAAAAEGATQEALKRQQQRKDQIAAKFQTISVDRSGNGAFPEVTGDAEPTIGVRDGSVKPDAVLVKTLKQGDGDAVEASDSVTVNYAGATDDGKIFDSSYKIGQPATFSLDQVIPGWGAGLVGQHVGDRIVMVIPAEWAYKNQPPQGSSIPPDATLTFVIDVVNSAKMPEPTKSDIDALIGATPSEDRLPEGLTVTGDLGEPPAIKVTDKPNFQECHMLLASGRGEEVAAGDKAYINAKVLNITTGEENETGWKEGSQVLPIDPSQKAPVPDFLTGKKVGSRVLFIHKEPAQPSQIPQSNAQPTEQTFALIIDITNVEKKK